MTIDDDPHRTTIRIPQDLLDDLDAEHLDAMRAKEVGRSSSRNDFIIHLLRIIVTQRRHGKPPPPPRKKS